jgi:phosphohistidine phosphatase
MLYQLFICRHAEVQAPSSQLADFDRGLTKIGHLEAEQAGKWLVQGNYIPDVILCSSAQRTSSTARIIANQIQCHQSNILLLKALYNARPAALLAAITNLEKSVTSALLVGHNPGVSKLIELLSGQDVGYVPTGSVHHLWFEITDWVELNFVLSLGYEASQK